MDNISFLKKTLRELNISSEMIFTYLGFTVELYPYVQCNPLRNDKKPNCYFEVYDKGLIFCDKTRLIFGKQNLTCWDAYRYKYQLFNLEKTLHHILENVSQIKKIKIKKLDKNKIVKTRSKINIRFKIKEWPKNNLFSNIGLSNTFLVNNDFYAVHSYYCNTHKDPVIRKNRFLDPKYFMTIAQFFKYSKNVKLYFPEAEEHHTKFYTNTNMNYDIFGLHEVFNKINKKTQKKRLVILSGGKDWITFKWYMTEFDCIAGQSESVRLSEKIIKYLAIYYEEIIILYDNDVGGIYNSSECVNLYNLDYGLNNVKELVISNLDDDVYNHIYKYDIENFKKIMYKCL